MSPAALPIDCASARSLLFVPGNRPKLFDKAVRSGADAVILDLEDSVPAPEKPSARSTIEDAWPRLISEGVPLAVRINSEGSEAAEADLECIARLPFLAAVMLPKAESAAAIERMHDRLHTGVLPLIESAAGLAAISTVAGARGVIRLVIGHMDFMADTGIQCDEAESELVPLRFVVAMATRLGRLPPAVDGVTVRTGDEARLRADTLRAVRFGFGGKLCIHPDQVRPVHEAFAPSPQELEWARRVIAADAASGGAAVKLDGRMIDLPIVLQARRTLARAAGGGARS
ncbi:MAG TPA: CoA ester lyase [Burkholderiaceae bacterium]|nr:CoA ester lyase [Burkholderiaceae bacterium]